MKLAVWSQPESGNINIFLLQMMNVMSWKFNSSHHNMLPVSRLNPNVMSDEFFKKNFLRWWQQTATLQQPYPFYNVRWHILYCKSIPFTLRKATFCVLIRHLSCCRMRSFAWWYASFLFAGCRAVYARQVVLFALVGISGREVRAASVGPF